MDKKNWTVKIGQEIKLKFGRKIVHGTWVIGLWTSDIKNRTSNIRHWTLDIGHLSSDIANRTLDIGLRTSNIENQALDIRDQNEISEIRHDRASDIENRTSDIGHGI